MQAACRAGGRVQQGTDLSRSGIIGPPYRSSVNAHSLTHAQSLRGLNGWAQGEPEKGSQEEYATLVSATTASIAVRCVTLLHISGIQKAATRSATTVSAR